MRRPGVVVTFDTLEWPTRRHVSCDEPHEERAQVSRKHQRAPSNNISHIRDPVENDGVPREVLSAAGTHPSNSNNLTERRAFRSVVVRFARPLSPPPVEPA